MSKGKQKVSSGKVRQPGAARLLFWSDFWVPRGSFQTRAGLLLQAVQSCQQFEQAFSRPDLLMFFTKKS